MKALYIMSSPRGGSTLLSLALGRHPDVANLGEVSFIPKLLALDELCTCEETLSECDEWAKVFTELKSISGVDMRETPYGLRLDDVMKYKSGTGKVDYQYQTKYRMLRSKVLGALDTYLLKLPFFVPEPSIKQGAKNTVKLYQAAAKAWNKKVLIDASKLPRKAIHLYKQAPDDVRIIHLTRDSRGVSASRKSHEMGLEHAAKRWRYYNSMALDLLERWIPQPHKKRLRYEDFVADPETSLRDLCEWLEIPYSEQMLDFSQYVSEHSAGGNPTRFKFSEGIRKGDERWRKILTEDDLQTIERINGDLNKKLGY